jgi:Tfp pilus assembly protein PilF
VSRRWTAALLVLAGCASSPPKPEPGPTTAPQGDTPEVPYQPKASTATAEQAPNPLPSGPTSGGATVVKTVPAPDATVAPMAAPAPPPPVTSTLDSASKVQFDRAIDDAMKHDVMSAERELKQLVDRHPNLDYAWTNLGVLYEREALPDQADRAYRKAIETKPDQETAWANLARLYCRTGKGGQIESMLRQQIQQYPAALGLRTALVFALLHQNKFDPAASEAKKILKADERDVHAMQLLAQVYFRQGKNELAKMVLENARAIDPNDAATLNALGLVDLALKAKPQALEAFKRASEVKPDFAEAKNNYGALLNETQDYENASRVLEDAVNAAPDFAAARLNLGNAYRGKQDFGKAMSQYKQVQRLKPDLADTYFNMAILHLDSDIPGMDPVERFNAAIAYFQQYQQKGGADDRVEQYIKDATKGIDKENRRKDREKKDQLRKAQREVEEKKRAEEEAAQKAEQDRQAAQKAQEEQQRQTAEQAKKDAAAQAEAQRKAAKDAAAAQKRTEQEAKREAAAKAEADRKAAREAAIAEKKAAEAARKERAAAAKRGAAKLKDDDESAPPPSRLSDENAAPPTRQGNPQPTPARKLGDDDK